MIEKIFGVCIRRIPSRDRIIYLTFDDGPHEHCTPKVLEVLAQHQIKATFFIVAETLQKNLSTGRLTVDQGHRIGNHSLDHKYRHFFCHKRYLMKWVTRSREIIEQTLQVETIGFRSPSGIWTPDLALALKALHYPLVHWSQRFFDTQRGLLRKDVRRVVNKLRTGDILLLHDSHTHRRDSFLEGLDFLLTEIKQRGFTFMPIPYNLFPFSLKDSAPITTPFGETRENIGSFGADNDDRILPGSLTPEPPPRESR